MRRLLLTVVLGAVSLLSMGQSWEYWGKPQQYLSDQGTVLLQDIDKVLEAYPPTTERSRERDLALSSLDVILHDTSFDDSEAFHSFVEKRVVRVVVDLDRAPSGKLQVYKIYNDGFVVRDRKACVAFDLCGTRGKIKVIPDEMMRAIVGKCDALFLSHKDPDHSDRNVIRMFLDAGKPVYASTDNNPSIEGISHIRKEVVLDTLLSAGGVKLQVAMLPGHQDDLQNNIWSVTLPSGRTVTHTGDQYREEDLDWLDNARSLLPRRTDVLIIDCWAMELGRTIKGFSPRVIVSGHENEIGHSIDHREAFWMTRYKYDSLGLGIPVVIQAWGERFDYKR